MIDLSSHVPRSRKRLPTTYLKPPYSESLHPISRKRGKSPGEAASPLTGGIQIPRKPTKEVKNPQRFPEPTVGGFILNPRGEVLLCHSKKWMDYYTIPGGHIELGERIVGALKREVMEEVGLDVEPVRLLLMQEAIYSEEFHKPRHFIFLDYLCKSNTSEVQVDNKEIQSYIWVKPEAALKMRVDTFTMRLLKEYLATQSYPRE